MKRIYIKQENGTKSLVQNVVETIDIDDVKSKIDILKGERDYHKKIVDDKNIEIQALKDVLAEAELTFPELIQ